MIFKDPKSLNLKTTIVNSNKNASSRIAHPLCWRWADYYTQIRKIRYPANHLLFFTYVLKLFLYFFNKRFALVALPTYEKVGREFKGEFCSLAVLLRPTSYMLSHQWCFVKVSLIKAWSKDCYVNNNR